MTRIRLLLGANVFWLAITVLVDGLSNLVLPAHLLATRGQASSATTLGLITFGGLLLAMLVQPLAGLFSDHTRSRWGRRGTLTVGVAFTLGALALFGASQHLLLILASYLAVQLGASVAQAAEQGFIPDLFAPASRGTAAGVKTLMDLGGALLGFVVLGQLLESGGTGPALLAVATVVLASYLLTVFLVREPAEGAAPPPERVSLRCAFRLDLKAHRAFVWLVVSRFLFLLGTYSVGRFLLLFVSRRLSLEPGSAAGQAGMILAALTLATLVAAVPAGWLADRLGRVPLMVAGALLGISGVLPLIWAASAGQILLFGSLLSLSSAAFAGANWALTADLVPEGEAARFFALANFGTAGAAAAAGLFGPLVDVADRLSPGAGFPVLFIAAALVFAGSALALRGVRLPWSARTRPTSTGGGSTRQDAADQAPCTGRGYQNTGNNV